MILNRQYQEACDVLKGASKCGGHPDQICTDYATALYGLGRRNEALTKLMHACKCNPKNLTALKNMSTVKGERSHDTGRLAALYAALPNG